MSIFNQIVADANSIYTIRTANTTDGPTQISYAGYAAPGASETDPVWMIKKTMVFTDESLSVLFAGGKASFSNSWASRESLNYI
ncbi:MAG: hypothetical protein HQL95_01680 [Magnetococcales bacterium]|nr:hypothetical protein [Magnetococcales bacterium]